MSKGASSLLKRGSSLLLLACLLSQLTLSSLALAYPGGEEVRIGLYEVHVGSVVDVPVLVVNAEGVAGGSVKISYDKSIVVVQRVKPGDFGDPVANIRNDEGFVYIAVAKPTAIGKSEAKLAILEFKGVSAGETTLRIENPSLNDERGNLVAPQVVHGAVKVISEKPPGASISIGSHSVGVGATVQVSVMVVEGRWVAGGSLEIHFNNSILEAVSVLPGDFGTPIYNIRNEGLTRIAVARPTAIGKDQAVLAILEFRGLREGVSTLYVRNAQLNDEKGNVITVPEGPVGAISVGVVGKATVSIEPPSITVAPNGEFEVSVYVNVTGYGVSGGEVTLSFDTRVMEVVSVEPGELLGPNPIEGLKRINNTGGTITYALARVGETHVPTPSGDFAKVRFKVKEGAEEGSYRLGIISVDLADEKFQEIPNITKEDGVVKVTTLRGDIDGNGVVDYRDLARLGASYGRRRGERGFDRAADLNGDGIVDYRDLAILGSNYGKKARHG